MKASETKLGSLSSRGNTSHSYRTVRPPTVPSAQRGENRSRWTVATRVCVKHVLPRHEDIQRGVADHAIAIHITREATPSRHAMDTGHANSAASILSGAAKSGGLMPRASAAKSTARRVETSARSLHALPLLPAAFLEERVSASPCGSLWTGRSVYGRALRPWCVQLQVAHV